MASKKFRITSGGVTVDSYSDLRTALRVAVLFERIAYLEGLDEKFEVVQYMGGIHKQKRVYSTKSTKKDLCL